MRNCQWISEVGGPGSRPPRRTRLSAIGGPKAACGVGSAVACRPSVVSPVRRRKQVSYRLPTVGPLKLFINRLDLLIYHSAGEAIDRNMHPVMLLSFHD